MAYKYENRYIKYDLTPILRQNRISLMWNKDSEKMRSNSGTKFVPFKLSLVHRRSLEKISSYFDTFPVFTLTFAFEKWKNHFSRKSLKVKKVKSESDYFSRSNVCMCQTVMKQTLLIPAKPLTRTIANHCIGWTLIQSRH